MKFILGAVGAVILLVLFVVLLTRGGPDSPNGDEAVKQKITLPDYVNGDAVVRLTMDGKINARENHQAVRITVGRTGRTVEVLRGYDYAVDKSQQFDNDITAYSVFLQALQDAGYANEKQVTTKKDVAGLCPLGSRYTYELLEGTEEKLRLWSTSCGIREGSFGGKAELIRQLFKAQIPDYANVTKGVQLN